MDHIASPSSGHKQFERRIRLAAPSLEVLHAVPRVQCLVDGEPLWFESPDMSFSASIEAFGSALLLAAAAQEMRLEFEVRPDDRWLRNTEQALAVAAEWWGYARLVPTVIEDAATVSSPSKASGAALCFSGGVDSFYTLLRANQRVDHLVFVQGYDMQLTDSVRAAAAEHSLRCVAAELGIEPVLVRTNLRAHHVARNANWEHVHGGALATVGHLMREHIQQLLISASYPYVLDRPWGSHWKLDPCWTSSRLSVQHIGAEKWRAEKLVALLDEALVRKHLRVCWENLSPSGNCGRCEKCLRTMLILDSHGRLADFPVFPSASTLVENLGRLPRLRPHLLEIYSDFLELDLSADVRCALKSLIERSRRAVQPGAIGGWWRRLRRA